MSAYGVIKRANNDNPLPPTLWPGSKLGTYVAVHHLTLPTAKKLDGLLEYLNIIFAKEVEEGRTYPQEGEMSQDTFEAYFFAADVFIGIIRQPKHEDITKGTVEITIEKARAGRPWEHCVAGYYYIKPNYPGRSSHICNAGFVVPPIHRGTGYGSVLAESYVHYAPKLGYQASVFNLVYVNNTASIKLWEKLDFIKAGKIPRAGRLRRKDGEGEEYVDAWVFYKSFIES
ncbi:hypothetical protein BDQ12DRAFT_730900 [Crucibulum laeve]|uniref:N-acetyltransferase domain-containing protein n=1 Tax=Crucibulum laeve TaxID=68775 RepID=A0A5C3MHP4_9AGAR|nr:hypothetical protein BDQ12DRAFT_730900 [Crucibulum laeve]